MKPPGIAHPGGGFRRRMRAIPPSTSTITSTVARGPSCFMGETKKATASRHRLFRSRAAELLADAVSERPGSFLCCGFGALRRRFDTAGRGLGASRRVLGPGGCLLGPGGRGSVFLVRTPRADDRDQHQARYAGTD